MNQGTMNTTFMWFYSFITNANLMTWTDMIVKQLKLIFLHISDSLFLGRFLFFPPQNSSVLLLESRRRVREVSTSSVVLLPSCLPRLLLTFTVPLSTSWSPTTAQTKHTHTVMICYGRVISDVFVLTSFVNVGRWPHVTAEIVAFHDSSLPNM